MLIRLDAIGDFVLWIDAAQHFRSLYPGRRIVLVANAVWADLASTMPYWDAVLPVDIPRLRTAPGYRLRTLSAIRRLGAALLVHPTFSRVLLDGDSVARVSGALERIGYAGDCSNISPGWKRVADGWYTRLIPAQADPRMEIERNTDFMIALGAPVAPALSRIPPLLTLPAALQPPLPYFVVFPGASWTGKRWPVPHYAEVIRQMVAHTGWLPVVCGGPDEHSICQALADAAGYNKLVNLAGRTSLAELVELLRGAELLFANDTSAVHFAVAVDTPAVCVLGGGHFGRFAPYPATLKGSLPRIASHQMECFGCNWNCIYPRDKCQPVPCVARVSTTEVLRLAEEVISPKKSIDKIFE